MTAEQKKTEEFAITEDDVSEIRQDINKFRYEMIEILKNNNFNTPDLHKNDCFVTGKRAKQMERRVLKGFNLSTVDTVIKEAFEREGGRKSDFFSVIAKAIGSKTGEKGDFPGEAVGKVDHIGSSQTFAARRMASYRKTVLARGGSQDDLNKMTAEELVQMNPKLKEYTPHTRLAYAKFKSFGQVSKLKAGKLPSGGDARVEQECRETTLSRSNSASNLSRNNSANKLSGLLKASTNITNQAIEEGDENAKSPAHLAPTAPAPAPAQNNDNSNQKLPAPNDNQKLIEFSPGSSSSTRKSAAASSDGAAATEDSDKQSSSAAAAPEPPIAKSPKSASRSINSPKSKNAPVISPKGSVHDTPASSEIKSPKNAAAGISTPAQSPLPDAKQRNKKKKSPSKGEKIPFADESTSEGSSQGGAALSPAKIESGSSPKALKQPQVLMTQASLDIESVQGDEAAAGAAEAASSGLEVKEDEEAKLSPLPSPTPRPGKGKSVISGTVRSGWL